MIRATIGDNGKKLWLEMQGHADGGEYGHDLICAAATMMAYTMAQVVSFMDAGKELEEAPVMCIRSGEALISFVPKDHAKGAMAQYVVRAGLECLAKNYPGHVAVYTVGNGEARAYKTEDSPPLAADMDSPGLSGRGGKP